MVNSKIAIINDTPVHPGPGGKYYTFGGTASFIGSILPLLESSGEDIQLIGNFSVKEGTNIQVHQIQKDSNLSFTFSLFLYFLNQGSDKDRTYYFHRPDHLFVSLFMKRKKLLHLHGNLRENMSQDRPWFINFPYLFLEYFALRMADKVIVTDKITKKCYLEKYPFLEKKLHLLPSGFDSIYFFPEDKIALKKEKGLSENKKYLIYVGRLAYPKQLHEIILGYNEVLKTRNDVELLIVGDGKDRPVLEREVSSLGLKDHIHFLGSLAKQDVCDYISCADAGILISVTEGSPISVKECLACGVPVLVNHVGDVEDYIIPGKTGYITGTANPADLAANMIRLIDDSGQMKDECIRVASQFSSSALFDKLLKIIDDIK
jgi:glycosyltransferase involved in cell wall biosynthesis